MRKYLNSIRWLQPLVVMLGAGAIYISTASYGGAESPYDSRDTVTAAVEAWGLAVRHTLNFRSFLSPSLFSSLWLVPGAHGMLVSNRFPGAVLLALPAYLLFGGSYSGIPAGLTAALAAAAAVACLFVLVRRSHGPKVALIVSALFAFGTANWSVSGKELWQHSGSELVILLGMIAFQSRRWSLAGLAFGAAILFRPHLGIGVAVVGISLLWTERRWAPFVKFGASASVGVAGYLLWNFLLFGHFTILGGYSSQVSAGGVGFGGFLDNIAGTFVSPERGLLFCSPVLALCAIGGRQAWAQANKAEKVWAFAGIAYLSSQLWLIRFSGGSGFLGYRTCLEALVWSGPLLVRAAVIGWRRVPEAISLSLSAASVAFFATGMFVPAETAGSSSPWSSYGPLQIAEQYGAGKVLLGAAIGTASVLIAWYASSDASTLRKSRAGGPSTPAVPPTALTLQPAIESDGANNLETLVDADADCAYASEGDC